MREQRLLCLQHYRGHNAKGKCAEGHQGVSLSISCLLCCQGILCLAMLHLQPCCLCAVSQGFMQQSMAMPCLPHPIRRHMCSVLSAGIHQRTGGCVCGAHLGLVLRLPRRPGHLRRLPRSAGVHFCPDQAPLTACSIDERHLSALPRSATQPAYGKFAHKLCGLLSAVVIAKEIIAALCSQSALFK